MPDGAPGTPRDAAPSRRRVLLRPDMLVLHAAGVVALVAAILLGLWQYDAWRGHREDRAAALVDAPAVPLASLLGPDDPFPEDGRGRPVAVQGAWLPQDAVYVADRLHDGQDGAWLVTPLAVCGSDCAGASAVPVVVGWTARTDAAAAARAPQGAADITGWLQPAEQARVADADPGDDTLPVLRIADLLQRVDRDLYSAFVVLGEPASARNPELTAVSPASLPSPPASTALRNLLYAVQWWIFGGLATFVWWRWTRDELAAARPATTAALPSGP